MYVGECPFSMNDGLESDARTKGREAIPEVDFDDLYAPADQVPEKTVREPIGDLDVASEGDLDLSSLNDSIKALQNKISDRCDDVADVIRPPLIDAVPQDDLKPRSKYDFKSMVCAWIYRLIAPSDGYSVVSWKDLAGRLNDNDDLAGNLGFGDDRPSEKTLRTQWQTRVLPAFRDHVRYMAAECAVQAEDYELETAEDIRKNLIGEYRPDEKPEVDPIGEMEQEIKNNAYTVQADIIQDVCSYGRDDSLEWEDNLITDTAAHMCRKNEYVQQGIRRMGKDYGLITENKDGSEEWNVFRQQTFRRAIRNVEWTKVEDYDWDNEDKYGARWVPPHELVDHNIARGTKREAAENVWTIDPHDPDGGTATWHRRTENGIERQIEWLKQQGVISEEDVFNLRVDYTNHDYCRHSSTDSGPPIGVHKGTHLDTGYAWKELQATIKINGRAFIIASLSYTPQNTEFQGVRYLLDRARELVNIDTVLADAEFVNAETCSYIKHCGCDYIKRKGATETVKETVAEFEGRADWDSNWTLQGSGRVKTHDTTLVALEKDFRSVPEPKRGDDDNSSDITLNDFVETKDPGEDDLGHKQVTLERMTEESHEDSENIDYFCMITSKDVDRVGIDPDEKPIGHDPEGSVWGIGRLYRDRWGVETAFRDKKNQFKAKTRSRDLGYRRFLWMIQNLLYNGWVMLNSAVSDQSPARDDDEIVVMQASYLDELDKRVLSGLSLDIEFPDQEFG